MIKAWIPQIRTTIEESNISDRDKQFIKIHLETVDSSNYSLTAQNEGYRSQIAYNLDREEELTNKCVLLNVMLKEFYSRFTSEEQEKIRKEVAECSKIAQKTSTS